MTNEQEWAFQFLESEHRARWQAKNEKGREALLGEFAVHSFNRDPLIKSYVEVFCNSFI